MHDSQIDIVRRRVARARELTGRGIRAIPSTIEFTMLRRVPISPRGKRNPLLWLDWADELLREVTR
jgi:hypothetical protein